MKCTEGRGLSEFLLQTYRAWPLDHWDVQPMAARTRQLAAVGRRAAVVRDSITPVPRQYTIKFGKLELAGYLTLYLIN